MQAHCFLNQRFWGETRSLYFSPSSVEVSEGVPGGQTVKNPPATQENWVWSLGREDPLKKGMAAHSGILAWRVPMDRGVVGYSPWGHKESDTTEQLTFFIFSEVS